MALIKCTECVKEFSDKAEACPNCGCPTEYSIKNDIVCGECGNLYSDKENACPKCGCPTIHNTNKMGDVKIDNKKLATDSISEMKVTTEKKEMNEANETQNFNNAIGIFGVFAVVAIVIILSL